MIFDGPKWEARLSRQVHRLDLMDPDSVQAFADEA